MSDKPRIVFDTNVLVSAAIFRHSTPRQALSAAASNGTVLLSQAAAEELAVVVARPKFDRYATTKVRKRFLAALLRIARAVEPSDPINACRDPKDNKFLELAVTGEANYVVTGDEDLLVLNPFRGIQIVTPAEFLDCISNEPNSPAAE